MAKGVNQVYIYLLKYKIILWNINTIEKKWKNRKEKRTGFIWK